MFIAEQIGMMFIDDFFFFSYEKVIGKIVKPLSVAYQRHADCFLFTH